MVRSGKFLAVFVTLALVGAVAQADDELDGKKVKTPAMVLQKLDQKTGKLVTYRVDVIPEGLNKDEIEKLSADERTKLLTSLIKSVEKKENELSSETAVKVAVAVRDNDTSTPACCWRGWGGWRFGWGGWGWGSRFACGWGWGGGGWCSGGWNNWGGGCGGGVVWSGYYVY